MNSMLGRVYVQISDGREGPYIVTEERPDGSLVVVPDTSSEAARKPDATNPETRADPTAEQRGESQQPDGDG
jgi:hypothetical protein